ncbi:MAG: DUF371 domain-containing protein [Candidatus Kariarchaeaceae archaeon]|jgi:hypothetical protein
MIQAWGHANVLGNHRTTFQFTTEQHLTPKGDCIIAVRATHAASTLPEELKTHLKTGGQVELKLACGDILLKIRGQGHPDMTFTHDHDMVFRRSSHVDGRTVTINTNMTAAQMPRELMELLQSPDQEITLEITIIN